MPLMYCYILIYKQVNNCRWGIEPVTSSQQQSLAASFRNNIIHFKIFFSLWIISLFMLTILNCLKSVQKLFGKVRLKLYFMLNAAEDKKQLKWNFTRAAVFSCSRNEKKAIYCPLRHQEWHFYFKNSIFSTFYLPPANYWVGRYNKLH